MEQIKQIKLPNGSTYEVVDATARQNIEAIPSWAKQSNKPSYTAQEVGAYTKAEIDNLELITEDEIDEICGSTIEVVPPNSTEVRF